MEWKPATPSFISQTSKQLEWENPVPLHLFFFVAFQNCWVYRSLDSSHSVTFCFHGRFRWFSPKSSLFPLLHIDDKLSTCLCCLCALFDTLCILRHGSEVHRLQNLTCHLWLVLLLSLNFQYLISPKSLLSLLGNLNMTSFQSLGLHWIHCKTCWNYVLLQTL